MKSYDNYELEKHPHKPFTGQVLFTWTGIEKNLFKNNHIQLIKYPGQLRHSHLLGFYFPI
jgi:hypothetical protein